tara:strand:- start:436 stop:609 length:174 start_codon:yes stop_codon:yes gene_type:complete
LLKLLKAKNDIDPKKQGVLPSYVRDQPKLKGAKRGEPTGYRRSAAKAYGRTRRAREG